MSSVTRKPTPSRYSIPRRHVGRDLVEVVEAHERAGRVQVVAPGEPLDVLDLVEELVREAERVGHAHGVADARDEPVRLALGAAAERAVVLLGAVDVLGRAHPERQRRGRGDRPLPQHQVVVDELLERAQVDRAVALLGHGQPEHVDVEGSGCGEVGDDQLGIGAADDVGRGDAGGGEGGHAVSPQAAPKRVVWTGPSEMCTACWSV